MKIRIMEHLLITDKDNGVFSDGFSIRTEDNGSGEFVAVEMCLGEVEKINTILINKYEWEDLKGLIDKHFTEM